MVKKVFNWVIRLLIAYVIVGSVYYLSGYFYNLSIGKDNVFSPILGYPLAVIGWPLSLYADFIHRQSLGIKPSFVVTILAIVLALFWFLRWIIIEAKELK
ncbi:MAG: hypothetical protein SCH68_02375 [Brevefilum sp.]|nr:hypothetical protein [Brevefilum sp.]